MSRPVKSREYLMYDVAAAVCGFGLFLYLFLTANRLIGTQDEVFYLTIPQRLLQGDRLIAEEWHFAQLGLVFDLLPYRVFTKITGGTEGIVLFMRYLFIAINVPFYVFLYAKLRRYRTAGVFSAATFCALIPQAICAQSYYTVSTMAVTAACMILLTDPAKKRPAALVFSGITVACGVLAEPLLVFLFLLYFTAAACRMLWLRRSPQRDGFGFILEGRTFLFILAGTLIAFAAFMAYMIFSGALRRLPEVLPYILKDKQYAGTGLTDLSKLKEAVGFYGAVPMVGLSLSFAAAALYRAMKKKNRVLRLSALTAVCFFTAWCCVHGAFAAEFRAIVEFHDFPVLLWAPAIYLLCDKKDFRTAALLITGLLFSALVDLSSANILGSGGRIALIAGAISLRALLGELKEEAAAQKTAVKAKNPAPHKGRAHRAVLSCTAVCAAVFLLWNLGFVYIEGMLKPQDTAFFEGEDALLTQKLESGPYKGLLVPGKIAFRYEKTLSDLDYIKENAAGKPVAVPDRLLYAYLYLDLPYGVPSAWIPYPYAEQYADYWTVHPEKQPAYIYLPLYNAFTYEMKDKNIIPEEIDASVEYEAVEGLAGLILKVKEIHPQTMP